MKVNQAYEETQNKIIFVLEGENLTERSLLDVMSRLNLTPRYVVNEQGYFARISIEVPMPLVKPRKKK